MVPVNQKPAWQPRKAAYQVPTCDDAADKMPRSLGVEYGMERPHVPVPARLSPACWCGEGRVYRVKGFLRGMEHSQPSPINVSCNHRRKCIHIHTFMEGFTCPCWTRLKVSYADFAAWPTPSRTFHTPGQGSGRERLHANKLSSLQQLCKSVECIPARARTVNKLILARS